MGSSRPSPCRTWGTATRRARSWPTRAWPVSNASFVCGRTRASAPRRAWTMRSRHPRCPAPRLPSGCAGCCCRGWRPTCSGPPGRCLRAAKLGGNVSAVYSRILNQVLVMVQDLDLRDWDNNPVPVQRRKLPAVREALDTVPCIIVSMQDEAVTSERATTEGHHYRIYPVQVAFVAAGDGDLSRHEDTYQDWHARVIDAFDTKALLATVPEVWDMDAEPGLILERAQIAQGYDYGGLVLMFTTCEV